VLSLCAGVNARRAQPEAIGALSGLMHSIIEAGCSYGLSQYIIYLLFLLHVFVYYGGFCFFIDLFIFLKVSHFLVALCLLFPLDEK
jgi:hypothetical protein